MMEQNVLLHSSFSFPINSTQDHIDLMLTTHHMEGNLCPHMPEYTTKISFLILRYGSSQSLSTQPWRYKNQHRDMQEGAWKSQKHFTDLISIKNQLSLPASLLPWFLLDLSQKAFCSCCCPWLLSLWSCPQLSLFI